MGQFLKDPTFSHGLLTAGSKANPTEADLSFSDITTLNASTSQHGLLKKLDNDPTHFMDGQGNWSAPTTTPGGSAGGDLAGSYPNPTVAKSSTAFALTADISPSQITANQDNYNPTGLSTSSVVRVYSDAARNITGLVAQGDGDIKIVHNIGSFTITLKDESGSSTAANHFAFAADITLAADESCILQYDSTSARWRCLGVQRTGTAGTVTSITAGTGLSGGTITGSGTIALDVLGLTADDVALADSLAGYDASGGDVNRFLVERLLGYIDTNPGGRLTLQSGSPVPTSDVTATTIYYTPHVHNRVRLYDGTRWVLYTFSEVSLALGTLTSGMNYDVWLYDNAGTLTLELLAWASDHARNTNIGRQDGVWIKSGSPTRLYLGTIRTVSTTQCTDSVSTRFVWNQYSRVRREVYVFDGTDSWNYTTDTWRQMNASTANQIGVVCGIAYHSQASLSAGPSIVGQSGASVGVNAGIGEDSTSAIATACLPGFCHANSSLNGQPIARLTTPVPLGYHYYTALERSGASGTSTWYGDAGDNTKWRAGITGFYEC